ncbi:MAG: hypothetical protein QGF93_02000 [Candidatus Marinimicrobia bacterium]|jgi:hypothetical protein|nr:hypothetical protein [Candidatus Neomarinimicrobiota bacterium]
MNLKSFSFIVAIVFADISLLHLERILFGVDVRLGNLGLPMQ